MAAYDLALQALADPTRRAVFEELRKGPLPVGRLAERFSVSRPAISQHLRVLKGAGLASERRLGTRRVYRVRLEGVVALRRYLESMWEDALSAFKTEAERSSRSEREKRKEKKKP